MLGARRNSATSLNSGSIRPTSRGNKTGTTGTLTEQELAAKAEETVLALKQMLGEEKDKSTVHANKANAMTKKKISYMINDDLDVAKDFLDLVEILKQHKAAVNKSLKESMNNNP